MAFFNKIEDGSRTILLMARESAGFKKKFAIGAGVLVVVLVGGGIGLSRYMTAKANEKIASSWSGLSRCMIGEPLAAGQRASVRVRAIQLTSMTQAETTRAPAGGEPWPNRCSTYAHALYEGLVEASKTEKGAKDLGYWTEKLAVAIKEEGAYHTDLTEVIDQTWEQAGKAGLVVGAVDVTAPPAAAQAMTVDALAGKPGISKTSIDMKNLQTEVNPGTVLRLLVEDKEVPNSPFICTLNAAQPGAKCDSLSADVASTMHGFRMLGTADDDADPLVFSGKNGADGVFRAQSGEKIDAAATYGGYAAKDGNTSLLTWDDASRQLRLVRKAAAKPKTVTPVSAEPKLTVGNAYYDSQLLWNQAVFRGLNHFKELWLAAAETSTGEPALGAVTEIGQLAEGGLADKPGEDALPQITGCRVAKALVVRARGERSEFLSFFVGGRWTKPVQVAGLGGTLSCRKAEAAITRVDLSKSDSSLDTAIVHNRCTPAACQVDTIKMDQFLKGELGLAPKALVAAADLDGKLVVVWGAGEFGGVRMRVAPPDKIAKTPDVILFDDLIKDGQVQKASTLFDARLYSRERFAVLVLSTSGGTFLIRIDSEGKFAQMPVEFEG
ncbi:MAG: hypothetical protein HY898_01190 [Deltaproteobacteria bacterium]|nr:hypothetical protein [Deltaproteobacteria bacterium]